MHTTIWYNLIENLTALLTSLISLLPSNFQYIWEACSSHHFKNWPKNIYMFLKVVNYFKKLFSIKHNYLSLRFLILVFQISVKLSSASKIDLPALYRNVGQIHYIMYIMAQWKWVTLKPHITGNMTTKLMKQICQLPASNSNPHKGQWLL